MSPSTPRSWKPPTDRRPVLRSPAHTTEYGAQVEASFRKFRESAVRLVEEENDRLEQMPSSASRSGADLRLIRGIFGKWCAEILLALHRRPTAGFEDLRRALDGISARVLSMKLKELEDLGMVNREIFDSRPPRVHYSLTEKGWTVTWLTQPIFVYIRATEEIMQSKKVGATERSAVAPGGPIERLGPFPPAGSARVRHLPP